MICMFRDLNAYDLETILNLVTTLFTNPDLGLKKMSARKKEKPRNWFEEYANSVFGDSSAWYPAGGLKFHKSAHKAACQVRQICSIFTNAFIATSVLKAGCYY